MRTKSCEILKINNTANHCTVPECDDAFLVVSKPVTLTILDAAGTPPPAGALVQVFDDETETMFNTTTNQSGQAAFTLPFGSYRFRANLVSDGNISKDGSRWISGAASRTTAPCRDARPCR